MVKSRKSSPKFVQLLSILLICIPIMFAGKVLAQGNVQATITSPLEGEYTTGNTITITGTASSPNSIKGVYVAIKSPDNKYLQSNYTFQASQQFFGVTNTGTQFSTWKYEISGDWFTQGMTYTLIVGVNDGAWHEFADPSWNFLCNNSNSKGVEMTADRVLSEDNLNDTVFTLRLSNMKYKSSISPDQFTLNNFPSGVSVAEVVLQDEYTAKVKVACDGTDFDDDRIITVTVKEAALFSPWNSLTTNSLQLTAHKDSLTIVPEFSLSEKTLHGAVLNAHLADTKFLDTELDKDNFLLINAPLGLSVARAVYLDSVTAAVYLSFTGIDFDEGIDDFCLKVKASEISGASDLTSNSVSISSVVESREKEITSFAVAEQIQAADIDQNNHTVTFRVPYGIAVTSLIPTISISEGAAISPGSGERQDFSQPVTYVVTAEDFSTQNWIVTCIVEPPVMIDDNDEDDGDTENNVIEDNDENNSSENDEDNNNNDVNETRSKENANKSDDTVLRETIRDSGKTFFSLTGRPEGKATFSLNIIDELVENNVPLIMENEGITVEFSPNVLKTSLLEQALDQGHSNVEIMIRELTDTGTIGAMARALTMEASSIVAIECKMFELSVVTYNDDDISNSFERITIFNEPVSVTFDMSFINLGDLHPLKFSGVRLNRETIDKPVLLGGTYDTLNKTFTFYTDKFSILTVGQAENLVTMSLSVGNRFSKVNGELRETDVSTLLFNNRVMVPLRFIGEALGAEFRWDENTGIVTVKQGMKELKLVINQPIPGFEIPATVINGRTLVPVRYIAESFGAHVMWFPNTGTVYIVN